jgi:hypothetical protein
MDLLTLAVSIFQPVQVEYNDGKRVTISLGSRNFFRETLFSAPPVIQYKCHSRGTRAVALCLRAAEARSLPYSSCAFEELL